MPSGRKTYKLGRQSSNGQNMVHITSLVMEKIQFNHCPIILLVSELVRLSASCNILKLTIGCQNQHFTSLTECKYLFQV